MQRFCNASLLFRVLFISYICPKNRCDENKNNQNIAFQGLVPRSILLLFRAFFNCVLMLIVQSRIKAENGRCKRS